MVASKARTRHGVSESSGPLVITDAHTAASKEQAGRQKRYIITMAFRTACFVAMIFVPGVGRWILFGCAVFLPYLAVIVANQADKRGETFNPRLPMPSDAPQLTTGRHEDLIAGDVHDSRVGDGEARDRVA